MKDNYEDYVKAKNKLQGCRRQGDPENKTQHGYI
jgi:hypothetical protein